MGHTNTSDIPRYFVHDERTLGWQEQAEKKIQDGSSTIGSSSENGNGKLQESDKAKAETPAFEAAQEGIAKDGSSRTGSSTENGNGKKLESDKDVSMGPTPTSAVKTETPAETFEAAEEGMARVKTARILLKYRSGNNGRKMVWRKVKVWRNGRKMVWRKVKAKAETPAFEDDTPKSIITLKGTAVNQDGRSSTQTAPHGPSQQAVILTLTEGQLELYAMESAGHSNQRGVETCAVLTTVIQVSYAIGLDSACKLGSPKFITPPKQSSAMMTLTGSQIIQCASEVARANPGAKWKLSFDAIQDGPAGWVGSCTETKVTQAAHSSKKEATHAAAEEWFDRAPPSDQQQIEEAQRRRERQEAQRQEAQRRGGQHEAQGSGEPSEVKRLKTKHAGAANCDLVGLFVSGSNHVFLLFRQAILRDLEQLRAEKDSIQTEHSTLQMEHQRLQAERNRLHTSHAETTRGHEEAISKLRTAHETELKQTKDQSQQHKMEWEGFCIIPVTSISCENKGKFCAICCNCGSLFYKNLKGSEKLKQEKEEAEKDLREAFNIQRSELKTVQKQLEDREQQVKEFEERRKDLEEKYSGLLSQLSAEKKEGEDLRRELREAQATGEQLQRNAQEALDRLLLLQQENEVSSWYMFSKSLRIISAAATFFPENCVFFGASIIEKDCGFWCECCG
eukprot:symbB.v1.2.022587.t2/scaffold1981.1/size93869/10